jgi:SgrR family transcriptional regulator
MIELNWIRFVPGRGRGHASTLTFLLHKKELLQQETKELVMQGEVETAFQLVKEFGESSFGKEQFLEWLSHYFGYEVDEQPDRYIETLKLPIYRSINTLDPAEAFYAFDTHMITQIFTTLVKYDYESQKIVGKIAHYWKSNEQATEWIFYLRKGVYFHHGRELVADDVMFSLTRLRNRAYAQNWLVQDIDTIQVLSRYTLKINLKNPNYLFLLFLSYSPTAIVPKDIYEQKKETNHMLPIGSGPYKVTKYTRGICILEAFDHYFQGRPFIDRIEILIVPETNEEFVFEPESDLLIVHTGEAIIQSVYKWKEDEILCGSSVK